MSNVPDDIKSTDRPHPPSDGGAGPHQSPGYVELLPPCNDACPAGENVQGWLAQAQAGRFQKAWEVLIRDNPFPAIHGRVCYHPCESSCNRGFVKLLTLLPDP